MLFDTLCGVVEKHFKKFTPLLRSAKVFNFLETDVLEEAVYSKEDQWEWAGENLHLPFKTIAVEDKEAVVIFSDMVKSQSGLSVERKFLLLAPFDKGFLRFGHGKIEEVTRSTKNDRLKFTMQGDLDVFYISGKKCIEIRDLLKDDKGAESEIKSTYEHVLGRASFYLGGMFVLNDPKRFVLETSSTKKGRGFKKIPRSAYRPMYTVITPHQIRHMTGWESEKIGERNAPIPHERRGHWRNYRSDRYVNLKGQRRWIDDIWIGQSEGKVGNKFYRVLLGKPPYDKE